MRLTNAMRETVHENINKMFSGAIEKTKAPENLSGGFSEILKPYTKDPFIHKAFYKRQITGLKIVEADGYEIPIAAKCYFQPFGYEQEGHRVNYYNTLELSIPIDELPEKARRFFTQRNELAAARSELTNAAREAMKYHTKEKAIQALPELEKFF